MVTMSADMSAPTNQNLNVIRRRVDVIDNARNGGGHFHPAKAAAPPQYNPDPQDNHHVGTWKALWNLWNELCTDLGGYLASIRSGAAWIFDTAAESWRKSAETPGQSVILFLRIVIMATWVIFNAVTINYAPDQTTTPSYYWPLDLSLLRHYTHELARLVFNLPAALFILFPGDSIKGYDGKIMYAVLLGALYRLNLELIPH